MCTLHDTGSFLITILVTVYHRSRGYSYKLDGTIENQDSFLKRMTGMFMLYVAIMVSVPRKNQQHPHGLRYAWSWLAATINLGELRKI